MSTTTCTQDPLHTSSTFPYDTLDQSPASFRLLRVLGISDGLVYCDLKTFSLHLGGQEWKALSYRWGTDNATELISLDGYDFYVRPNLHGFLKRMAEDEELGWIFVDAICINQSDFEERALQVRFMGDIYKKAQEVMIWIPIDINNGWHKSLQDVNPKALEWAESQRGFRMRKHRKAAAEAKSGLQHVIGHDRYWSRLWIVQEILLASKVTIIFANFRLDMSNLVYDQNSSYLRGMRPRDSMSRWSTSHLSTGTNTENTTDPRLRTTSDKLSAELEHLESKFRAEDIMHMRAIRGQELRDGKLLTVHEAIASFGTMRCKLTHDRVFGLLGIASTRIDPDYSRLEIILFIDILTESLISLGLRRGASVQDLHAIPTDVKGSLIRAVGTAIHQGFDVDSTHVVIFLVVHELCAYFMPGNEELLHGILIIEDMFWNDNVLSKRGFHSRDRKWYETSRASRTRQWREVDARFNETKSKLEDQKRRNELLTAPWRTNDDKEDTRSYEDWAQLVKSRCEGIWRRWNE